jgi:hypothetical protein
MRTLLALILTAASLAVGCFLLGYGTAEWWRRRPPVHIKGLVWDFSTAYEHCRDAYFDRVEKAPVPHEVHPFKEPFDQWPQEATARLSRYDLTLPARTADIGLEGLADIPPPFTIMPVYVDPEAAAQRDRRGAINVRARYALVIGRKAYVFVAATEWDAEAMAKAILWQLMFAGDGSADAPED